MLASAPFWTVEQRYDEKALLGVAAGAYGAGAGLYGQQPYGSSYGGGYGGYGSRYGGGGLHGGGLYFREDGRAGWREGTCVPFRLL